MTIDEYREKVKIHDMNMESLANAQKLFDELYVQACESGKAIDSRIVLIVEKLGDKEWISIKEIRSVYAHD